MGSRRSPMMQAGLQRCSASCDAFLRTPVKSGKQVKKDGLVRGWIVSTPASGVDASQRSPAMSSIARPGCGGSAFSLGSVSWGGAIASVAATNAAAASDIGFGRSPGHGSPLCTTSACSVPEVVDSDPVKCLISGITGTSELSGEALAEWLRAAAPETYDD